MKKHVWLIAALTALTLIFTACGGGSSDDPVIQGTTDTATGLYISTTEGGTAVNTGGGKSYETTSNEQNIYVYFVAPGRNFEKIVFDFTLNPGGNFTVTALYGRSGGDACTWGKQTWDTDYYEGGPLDILSTDFTADWSSTGDGGIIKSTMFGFCVNIAATGTVFTVNNVTFVGLEAAVDKSELNSLIAEIEQDILDSTLDEAEYTTDSWSDFEDALAYAKLIAGKPDATVQEIADAITGLNEAKDDLVPAVAVDKTALSDLITQAGALDRADYTTPSWNLFQSALSTAETVRDASNSTQTQVDNAREALADAINALVDLDPVDTLLNDILFEDGDWATDVEATFTLGQITGNAIHADATEKKFYVNFNQPVNIADYGAMVVDYTGSTLNLIFTLVFQDGITCQLTDTSWAGRASPFKVDFVADAVDWNPNKVGDTNGLLSSFEIYGDNMTTNGTTVTKISFEAPYEGLQPDPTFTEEGTEDLLDVVKVGTGAALVDSSLVKLGTKSGSTVIQVAPNAQGEFRLQINFNPTLDITAAEEFVMSWLSSAATSADFNISFTMQNYVESGDVHGKNMSLTGTVSNTDGVLDLVDDRADWGGWEGPDLGDTDGICSQIEIYSNDATLDGAYLYVTSIDVPNAVDGSSFDPIDYTFTLTDVEFMTGSNATAAQNWYLADSEGGSAAVGNSKTYNFTAAGDTQYVYIYFTASVTSYDSIRLTFTATTGTSLNLQEQMVYTTDGVFGKGWGSITSPATLTLTDYNDNWYDGAKPVSTNINGVCLKIDS